LPHESGPLPRGAGLVPCRSRRPLRGSSLLPHGSGPLPHGVGPLPSGAGHSPCGSSRLPPWSSRSTRGARRLPLGADRSRASYVVELDLPIRSQPDADDPDPQGHGPPRRFLEVDPDREPPPGEEGDLQTGIVRRVPASRRRDFGGDPVVQPAPSLFRELREIPIRCSGHQPTLQDGRKDSAARTFDA
jgi:hypothetical protein